MSTTAVVLVAFSNTVSALCNGKPKLNWVQEFPVVPPTLKTDSRWVPLAPRTLRAIRLPVKGVGVFKLKVRLYWPGGSVNGFEGETHGAEALEFTELCAGLPAAVELFVIKAPWLVKTDWPRVQLTGT